MENTTISSCCKISADVEVRKKKEKKSVSYFPVHENYKGSGLICIQLVYLQLSHLRINILGCLLFRRHPVSNINLEVGALRFGSSY